MNEKDRDNVRRSIFLEEDASIDGTKIDIKFVDSCEELKNDEPQADVDAAVSENDEPSEIEIKEVVDNTIKISIDETNKKNEEPVEKAPEEKATNWDNFIKNTEPKAEEAYQTKDELFMKKTKKMGEDLCDEDTPAEEKKSLEDYPVEHIDVKNTDDKEVNTEENEEAEEEIAPTVNPEVSITTDEEIEIEEPKDFSELVSDRGEVLEQYISGNAKFDTISDNLHICIELAKLFAKLHSLDYCFNGMSAEDIVIVPSKECKIFNKDKVVAINDDSYEVKINKLCAPEIIRGEARPSENTDRHTLAVLIFGLLFKSNPFEGSKFLNTVFYSKEEEIKYYENPVFVYSHKDKSNAPVYGINSLLIKYWQKYYSEHIRMMFKQTLVGGIEEPESRVDENSIIKILSEYKALRDQATMKKKGEEKPTIKIETKKKEPVVVNTEAKDGATENSFDIKIHIYEYDKATQKHYISENSIELYPGKELKNSLVGYEDTDNDKVIAKVIQNAKNKSILGIKNLSEHTWIAEKGDVKKEFPAGKVVVISNEVEIDFYPENKDQSKPRYMIYCKK